MGKLARLNKKLREKASFPTPARATTDDLMAFLSQPEVNFQHNPQILQEIIACYNNAKQLGIEEVALGVFPQDCDRDTGEIIEIGFGAYCLSRMLQCSNNPFEYEHIEDLKRRKSSKIVVDCVRKYAGRKGFYPIFYSSVNWLWDENHPLLKFRPGGYATCADAFWLVRDSSDFQFVHCSEVEENFDYYEIEVPRIDASS